MEFDKRKALFVTAFLVLALAAYQIQFSIIIGAPAKSFSLFEFLGPIGSQLFSIPLGVASVLVVEAVNFIVSGQTVTAINIARFLPMVFAAVYFGIDFAKNKNLASSKVMLLVPLACMALFIANPEGQGAWFYSLFWTIPVIVAVWFNENLVAMSLGATFTAHAVGSVAFLYAFNIPTATWAMLVPITAVERGLFALGIAASVVVFSTALDAVENKVHWKVPLHYDVKYSLLKTTV